MQAGRFRAGICSPADSLVNRGQTPLVSSLPPLLGKRTPVFFCLIAHACDGRLHKSCMFYRDILGSRSAGLPQEVNLAGSIYRFSAPDCLPSPRLHPCLQILSMEPEIICRITVNFGILPGKIHQILCQNRVTSLSETPPLPDQIHYLLSLSACMLLRYRRPARSEQSSEPGNFNIYLKILQIHRLIIQF